MNRFVVFVSLALAASLPAPAFAQSAGDLFSGLQSQSDAPVEVTSDTLEVFDDGKNRITVFSGNVTVKRGNTVLKAADIKLTSPLESEKADAFTRIEASGKVWVNSGDQTLTGETAVVNMIENTITVSGGVVLTQGTNILTGTRLVVNLATGRARVEGSTRGVFSPGG